MDLQRQPRTSRQSCEDLVGVRFEDLSQDWVAPAKRQAPGLQWDADTTPGCIRRDRTAENSRELGCVIKRVLERQRGRAIENGVPIVRGAASGLSAAIDPWGRVLSVSDSYAAGDRTMTAELPVGGISTLYARTGDWFSWLCAVGLAAMLAWILGIQAGRAPIVRPLAKSRFPVDLPRFNSPGELAVRENPADDGN